jgi:hypothetical protein
VPNSQLIKEGSALATVYQNRSIAEQNSLNLTWDLLIDNSYTNLRAAIYSSEEELRRFRQLLVNSVMATDIMDNHLGTARKARWNKAFSHQSAVANESAEVSTNRKATIVIEHLLQASDVAHTVCEMLLRKCPSSFTSSFTHAKLTCLQMQHWHIFCKWNEALFKEMYRVRTCDTGR